MSHILMIDDDRDIRELVSYKLIQAGYEFSTANDGEEGLKKAALRVPDLVLLDLMMPRMSGLEVCERLRSSEETAHTPIIMLTAKAQDADRLRGLQAGADEYMVKPFSPRDLLDTIRKLLSRAN